MTLKLGKQHHEWEYYQDYTNYDAVLTLTYFMPISNLVTKAFVWVKVKTIYFFKTVAVFGFKIGWRIQPNK